MCSNRLNRTELLNRGLTVYWFRGKKLSGLVSNVTIQFGFEFQGLVAYWFWFMWCRQTSDNNNVRLGYYDNVHTEKIEMVRPKYFKNT